MNGPLCVLYLDWRLHAGRTAPHRTAETGCRCWLFCLVGILSGPKPARPRVTGRAEPPSYRFSRDHGKAPPGGPADAGARRRKGREAVGVHRSQAGGLRGILPPQTRVKPPQCGPRRCPVTQIARARRRVTYWVTRHRRRRCNGRRRGGIPGIERGTRTGSGATYRSTKSHSCRFVSGSKRPLSEFRT